jgi:hypothetical protein
LNKKFKFKQISKTERVLIFERKFQIYLKNLKKKNRKTKLKKKKENWEKEISTTNEKKSATRSALLGRPTPARGCAARGPRRPDRHIGFAAPNGEKDR